MQEWQLRRAALRPSIARSKSGFGPKACVTHLIAQAKTPAQIIIFGGHLNATSTEIRRFRADGAANTRRMTASEGMEAA